MLPFGKIKEFSGPAPTPFVGSYNYPHVNIGILGAPSFLGNAQELDAPTMWANQGFGIEEIINLRSSLINCRTTSHVRLIPKQLSIAQEISMASKPPEVEVHLSTTPSISFMMDERAPPHGPAAPISSILLADNPTISTKIEKVFSDTDLKTAEAAAYLYDQGFEVHHISRMLSVGVLGLTPDRKLVPTKWSITANDDLLGKHLIEAIKDFPHAQPAIHFGSYLGNHYAILIFPGVWSFELFETMVEPHAHKPPETIQSWTDHEGSYGRKTYAANTLGGYYACRLAALEHLASIKRQASVLALRFVTQDYSIPLGVWVVREATRTSFEHQPLTGADDPTMLQAVSEWALSTFHINISGILKKSKLLSNRTKQKTLNHFIIPPNV